MQCSLFGISQPHPWHQVCAWLCKGFAVQPKLTTVAHTQAEGMLLFPGFDSLTHISKAVGLFLTPPGTMVLLASVLGWFLKGTRRWQSCQCV